ncbi:MAG TPA: c-type cytochrome [Solirubrobacteraceae bacterium]|nr:c-type cytochrome [Solirubrobacteraceae bacterium]
MLAVSLLIAAFLIVGLAVVAFAFASGRRRTAAGAQPSRGANRLLYSGVAIVVVGIGLALPLALLIGNADSADVKAVGGVDLTAAQAHGRELFASNCATCHALKASNSTGAIGPNLDVLRPPAGLVENAILVGRARGAGNMPAALLTGADAKDVASYVAAVAGRDDVTAPAPAPAAGN